MSADDSPTPRDSERSPRAPARAWLYRALAAAGVPLALFLGLEGGLRTAGVGRSAHFLIPDEKPGYFRTNPDFLRLFLPGSFDLKPLNFRISARKAPNALRVVLLGESAVQGTPAPSFGFAAQLRAQLRARYPGREVEVVNTGIVAVNSHVIYQVARDLAGFSPDLFVVYMGNNEVVGPYGPGCAYLPKMPPLWVIRLSVFVRSTRTGQLVAALLDGLAGRDRPPPEWGGMAMFVNNAVSGDDPRLDAVYGNFEANLRDIVRVAAGAGAKTLLCTVACNVKDCAPFLSVHRAGLTEAEAAEWGRAFNRGRIEWLLGEAGPARIDLRHALQIDPQYADTSFMLGSLDLQAGDTEAARRHLVDAEHWDALRFRPDPRINGIIREVARAGDARVSLLDAAMLMGSDPKSSAAPAGRELFFEHVHFDWEGNYQLARSMAEASEAALLGAGGSGRPWLDSQECAAAVAYTSHERLSVLQKIATIVENPPFTNQLTYCEDEAGLAHELSLANADLMDPVKLRRAKQVVEDAISRDRENADLAKMAEGVDDDLGDVAGALAQIRRAQELQPRSFALATDEATKITRIGRYDEAERLLEETAASCPPRDRAAMAPAFADLFTRAGRFGDGRRYLDSEISRRPADRNLRLVRGRLARSAGDTAAAEREFRAILAVDPGNRGALEDLVSLLDRTGRSADVEEVSLAALDKQPRNLNNNLRVGIACDLRGDREQLVRCLLAAERSGPVNSGVEMKLAKNLLDLQRLDEGLTHLAEARRISLHEGNPAATESIGKITENIRSQMR